jgi:alcohol dehydrogenase (cytochrome c)
MTVPSPCNARPVANDSRPRSVDLPDALRRPALGVVALAALAMAATSGAGAPAARAPDAAPRFTAAQVARGHATYALRCSSCHGASLEGGAGPPLSGTVFASHWLTGRYSVADLHFIVSTSMPLPTPASLPARDYLDITAYVLATNGYRPGRAELGAATLSAPLTARAPAAAEAGRPALYPAAPASVHSASTDQPSDAELSAADPADWLMYNRDYGSQRYSPLDQINGSNASHLAVVCAFQTGESGWYQASPVVYKGRIYVTTAYNTYAVDGRDCHTLWVARYKGATESPVVQTRGAALYRGKLFRTTPDGHLLALDLGTGAVLWDATVSDDRRGYWLSGAPLAYSGKVFVGEAGAEAGITAHIFAFDAQNGARLWTFNVVPRGGEPGADTWASGSEHGGGSSWSSFSLSPEHGLLYAPIGNPAPDFNGDARPGANLYTDSIVALDVDTGHLDWYAQQVPHDVHDWDTGAAPALYELNGRRLAAVTSKSGFLYLYDRASHALVAKSEVSTHLNIDQPVTPEGVRVCPGLTGGVQWNGPAYSPPLHMLFVNSVEWCGKYRSGPARFIEGASFYGGRYEWEPAENAHGWIRAFDAGTGAEAWAHATERPMVAGITATAAGILFTGDLAGRFLVLAARDGTTLYSFNTGGSIAGAVSTYAVGGRQYVAVPSGHNAPAVWRASGSASLFVFAVPER